MYIAAYLPKLRNQISGTGELRVKPHPLNPKGNMPSSFPKAKV